MNKIEKSRSQSENTPSNKEIDFINKLSAEFLQADREELFKWFDNELFPEGKEWFANFRRREGDDKAILFICIYKLDVNTRSKLFRIVRQWDKPIDFGIGLHRLGNVGEIFKTKILGHPKYFKNLPKN